ncbi:MAG: pro-sigmaK processing inhibitor BofA family protein [Mycoplasmatota bacterium]|nr:pro-sigmaK processing inhibitor BofA family protein [Mycoplasmatota bacterium]
MFKKIFNIIKKIVVAVLLIYGYNKLALPLDIVIPMNIFTILLVTLFGIPSILMLILFSLVCI